MLHIPAFRATYIFIHIHICTFRSTIANTITDPFCIPPHLLRLSKIWSAKEPCIFRIVAPHFRWRVAHFHRLPTANNIVDTSRVPSRLMRLPNPPACVASHPMQHTRPACETGLFCKSIGILFLQKRILFLQKRGFYFGILFLQKSPVLHLMQQTNEVCCNKRGGMRQTQQTNEGMHPQKSHVNQQKSHVNQQKSIRFRHFYKRALCMTLRGYASANRSYTGLFCRNIRLLDGNTGLVCKNIEREVFWK